MAALDGTNLIHDVGYLGQGASLANPQEKLTLSMVSVGRPEWNGNGEQLIRASPDD
jgi:hypothetical protein